MTRTWWAQSAVLCWVVSSGNTIGGGTGRSLATAAGAVAGGVAGQGVQGAMNKTQGVELEIRKDDGSTIMVVQKQGNTRFSAGQRVVLASNGSRSPSPRVNILMDVVFQTASIYQKSSFPIIYWHNIFTW